CDWSFPGRRAADRGGSVAAARPGGRSQSRAAAVHGGIQAADRARGGSLHQARGDWSAASSRGAVLLAPGDVARSARPRRARGAVAEEARTEGGAARSARQEDRGAGAFGAAVAEARGAS